MGSSTRCGNAAQYIRNLMPPRMFAALPNNVYRIISGFTVLLTWQSDNGSKSNYLAVEAKLYNRVYIII